MKNHRTLSRLTPAIVLGLLTLIWAASSAAGERLCETCKKPIGNSAWVEAEGRVYHQNHFVCAHCGKPIIPATYFKHDGRYYDSTCYAENITQRCGYCGKPIMGDWIGDDSAVYHTSCYLDHVAARCIVCGEAISGQHYYDDFGNFVCAEHHEKVSECNSCGRFLPSELGSAGEPYPDGRLTCSTCRASAIMELDGAKLIMEDLREQLAAKGIRITGKVGLNLASQGELNDAAEGYPGDRLGVTVYEKQTEFPRIFTLKNFHVHILYGLPIAMFRSVAAHELMHVWLYQNGPEYQEQLLSEGSCQYASYTILSDDTSGEARQLLDRLLKDPDPVYGEGLHRVMRMVSQYGVEGWLDYLKTNSELPRQD